MSDQEINAAIALACGWTDIKLGVLSKELIGRSNNNSDYSVIPNYVGDLNAMHEAEQALWARDWNLRYDYIDALARVENPTIYNRLDAVDMLDLTPRQRAEAFLRVLGKWEEEI